MTNRKWNLQDIRPTQPRRPRQASSPPLTEVDQSAPKTRRAPYSTHPARETSDSAENPSNTISPTQPVSADSISSVRRPRKPSQPPLVSQSIPSRKRQKIRFRTTVIAGGALLLLVIGGFVASTFMGGTELTIRPKFREPNVINDFVAFSGENKTSPDQLGYEVLTLEATGERQITATGEQETKTQAEGTIVISNRHSANPVRLVANTRFQTDAGLVFRIKDSAVIPGYTTNDAGETVPGTYNAEIFADEVGEQYNIPAGQRLTIPGFAGQPEFENIIGESQGNFAGGFDGVRYSVNQDELNTALENVRQELRASLIARIATEQPAGFIYFPGSETFTYQTADAEQLDAGLVSIRDQVTMRVPLFASDDFAAAVALATIPEYKSEDQVRIQDPTVLEFEYTSTTTSETDIANLPELPFRLEGRPLIVWEYDAEALKQDLLGKPRTAFNVVLSGYPGIEPGSQAVIRPFWSSSFPSDPADITVVEVIKEE